jgi:hypothetical protein
MRAPVMMVFMDGLTPENGEQNDDGNRYANQPKKNSATHKFPFSVGQMRVSNTHPY